MAYFYVKSGGTATGDGGRYASQQTGSFAGLGASGYYNTINDAYDATTTPTGGDFVCVSDAHAQSGVTLVENTGSNGPITIITVSDSNVDQGAATPAAKQIDSIQDFSFSGQHTFINLHIEVDREVKTSSSATCRFEGCRIDASGTTDTYAEATGGNTFMEYINCDFSNSIDGAGIHADGGGRLVFRNCKFPPNTNGVNWYLIRKLDGNTSGGGEVTFIDCDLSNTEDYFTQTAWDFIQGTMMLHIHNCKLSAALINFAVNSPSGRQQEILVTASASTDDEAEYQYYWETFGGVIEDDSSIFRDETVAFPRSGVKISHKMTTTADTSVGVAFEYSAMTIFADLSENTSDKLTIYLASTDSALKTNDVYVEVSYPDDTNPATRNFTTTRPADIWDESTALTTDAGSTWKSGQTTPGTGDADLSGYTEYKIDIDLNGLGSAGVPTIRLYVTKPSTTLYIDPVIELS